MEGKLCHRLISLHGSLRINISTRCQITDHAIGCGKFICIHFLSITRYRISILCLRLFLCFGNIKGIFFVLIRKLYLIKFFLFSCIKSLVYTIKRIDGDHLTDTGCFHQINPVFSFHLNIVAALIIVFFSNIQSHILLGSPEGYRILRLIQTIFLF